MSNQYFYQQQMNFSNNNNNNYYNNAPGSSLWVHSPPHFGRLPNQPWSTPAVYDGNSINPALTQQFMPHPYPPPQRNLYHPVPSRGMLQRQQLAGMLDMLRSWELGQMNGHPTPPPSNNTVHSQVLPSQHPPASKDVIDLTIDDEQPEIPVVAQPAPEPPIVVEPRVIKPKKVLPAWYRDRRSDALKKAQGDLDDSMTSFLRGEPAPTGLPTPVSEAEKLPKRKRAADASAGQSPGKKNKKARQTPRRSKDVQAEEQPAPQPIEAEEKEETEEEAAAAAAELDSLFTKAYEEQDEEEAAAARRKRQRSMDLWGESRGREEEQEETEGDERARSAREEEVRREAEAQDDFGNLILDALELQDSVEDAETTISLDERFFLPDDDEPVAELSDLEVIDPAAYKPAAYEEEESEISEEE